MSEVASQPQEQKTHVVTAETGSEDEAVNALMKREAQQGQAEDQSEASSEAEADPETLTDEPENEADAETDEGDPEDAEDEGELVEVEYEGKAFKVPPELKDAVLRKADYSRNMQEVSAQRKEVAQRIESADKLIEGAEKYAEVLAQVSVIDQQIKQLESIDFDALERDDPAQASILALKLMRAQQSRDKAVNGAQGIEAELEAERQKIDTAKRGEMLKALEKDLPGWGDELGTKITQYAIKHGFTASDLQSLTDPKVVIALNKARKFDAIQEGKAAVKTKAQNAPPVVKPGAKRPAVNPADNAMARFAKSKSDEDAIAALESRSRTR